MDKSATQDEIQYCPGSCTPGQTNDINEPIVGRTKLTKMMYLFEKEIYPKFFNDTLTITLPQFEPYYFGPFSKELFEDLSFFKAIGLIETSETNIPLSPAHRMESEKADNVDLDDEWSEASFDSEENEEEFESQYFLTTNGKKYVTDKVWDSFSLPQKEKLKQFKAQINRSSLDSLLRYVYTKYPDDAVNSVIADKYLKKADE